MPKFTIQNRTNGKPLHTIEVPETIPLSERKTFAARKVVEEQGSIIFNNANLRGVDLSRLDLTGVILRGADLTGANLSRCDLSGVILSQAILQWADLEFAKLRDAVLSDASLRGADLTHADLSGAYLYDADLRGVCLHNADLTKARLWDAVGDGIYVRTLQTPEYTVTYTHDRMQIGCQSHAIKDWWSFTDDEIVIMASGALDWWRVWKPILRKLIKVSPCQPTKEPKS